MIPLSNRRRLLIAAAWIPFLADASESSGADPREPGARRGSMRLATGQSGGVYHALAEGISQVLQKEGSSLEIELVETDGSGESMRLLESGDCEFALVQNGTPSDGTARLVAQMHEEFVHLLVRAGSPIKAPPDLRGRRVAIGPADSGTRQLVVPLIEHFGLDMDAIDPRFGSPSDACMELLDDRIDAALLVAGLGAPVIESAVARGDTVLVPLGADPGPGGAIAGFQVHYPFVKPAVIPRYCYAPPGAPGGPVPPDPVVTAAVRSLLVCHSGLDTDAVESFVRFLHTARPGLMAYHPLAIEIKEPSTPNPFAYAIHPGADAYYKRGAPGFLERYAEVFALALSLLLTIGGATAAIRRWMARRKKNRIDDFYEQIDSLMQRLRSGSPPPETLASYEAELLEIRHRAFTMLVREKLEADESFRIFQSLVGDCLSEIRIRLGK